MKLKKYFVVLTAVLISLLAFTPARAQDSTALTISQTTAIVSNVSAFLATSEQVTNWTFIPYASKAVGLTDSKGHKAEWGGGIAALYPIYNNGVNLKTGLRLQYFAGELFMPSVNAQISSTYNIGGGATWTPFAFGGVAIPIGGSAQNGDVGVLYGGGASLKYPISKKWDVGMAIAWEEWSALKVNHVEHFGLVLNYKF